MHGSFITIAFYVAGAVILAVIGFIMGLSFLCIKLTLYYMPFYFSEFHYGRLQEKKYNIRIGANLVEAAITVSLLVYLWIINRYNHYSISDDLIGIGLRVISSLAGFIATCGLNIKVIATADGSFSSDHGETQEQKPSSAQCVVQQESITGANQNRLASLLCWVGTHSLEIYLIPGLLLSIIMMDIKPEFLSPQG